MNTDYELLKKYPFSLKEGVESEEFVLEDNIGGNIYFTVKILYINSLKESKTDLKIKDPHHGHIIIGTQPLAKTVTGEPFSIGKFQKKELLLGVNVSPIQQDGTHNVVISFYISK